MLKNRIGLTRCRLDKLSTPDDAKDQFEKQAYTRRLPFASRKSTKTQGSTTLTASTPGPYSPPSSPPSKGARAELLRRIKPNLLCQGHRLHQTHRSCSQIPSRDRQRSEFAPWSTLFRRFHRHRQRRNAVPLRHRWSDLSPMMESELGMVSPSLQRLILSVISNQIVRHRVIDYQLRPQSPAYMVGFYEAPESVGDMTLSRVGEGVVAKINENYFPTLAALVVSLRKLLGIRELSINQLHIPQLDGSKLGEEGSAALVVRRGFILGSRSQLKFRNSIRSPTFASQLTLLSGR